MNFGLNDTSFLSLDLWDTLLRRRCHPDEVKLSTAQRMILLLQSFGWQRPVPSALELLSARQIVEMKIGVQRQREGYDDEYEIEEVLRACLIELIKERISSQELTDWTETLVRAEIEQEIYVTYPDPDLLSLLENCGYESVYIVSDFYMSALKIAEILQAHALPFNVDGYFISCDSGFNKRSGRLFQHVCKTLAIEPGSLIHIGDNLTVDVDMAKKEGVQAIHFVGERGEVERTRLRELFVRRSQGRVDSSGLLCNAGKVGGGSSSGDREQESLRAYGRFLAPLFVGFSTSIQYVATTGGHESVFFFTREGRFLKQVFERVSRHSLYGMQAPVAHLLPVSRVATFFPSVRAINPDEMMRLWSQYHTQSINSFLSSLGLELDPFQQLCRFHDIDPDEMVSRPWEHRNFLLLFNDQKFVLLLCELQGKKRAHLKEFLRQSDFGVAGRALVVDIGWRGTIQDNLAFILPETFIEGCYLGLQRFLNSQASNTVKHGYIADDNRQLFHLMLKFVMPFEMLCFAAGGSATGYQRDATGRIAAEFQVDPEEDRLYYERIRFFQEGVLDSVDDLCTVISRHGLSFGELRNEAGKLAQVYLDDPPDVMCRAFQALKQDDTFGMARTILPGSFSFRLGDRLFSRFSARRRERFLADLEQSCWPQYLLRSRYYGFFNLLGRIKRRWFG